MSPTVRKRTYGLLISFTGFGGVGHSPLVGGTLTGFDGALAHDDWTGMGEVDRRWFGSFFFARCIARHHFRPVGDQEGADVFTLVATGVVRGSTVLGADFRIPLTNSSEAENAFFGASFFFIAASTTDTGIKARFFNRFQGRH